MTEVRHDAKYSRSVVTEIMDLLHLMEGPIVDPFAGVGVGLAELAAVAEVPVYGIEIEWEWATANDLITHGDALDSAAYDPAPRGVVTSPCYGNRFSGNYLGPKCIACDGKGRKRGADCSICKGVGRVGDGRHGYAISLGHEVHDRSAAKFDYIDGAGRGEQYKLFHRQWLTLMSKILPEGPNRLLVNMSDHFRTVDRAAGSERQYACAWWASAAYQVGFNLTRMIPVETPRMGEGRNGEKRVEHEVIMMFDSKGRR